MVTLPGDISPSFRLLVPEWISASNIDILAEVRKHSAQPKPFHTVPGVWKEEKNGVWVGVETFPKVMEFRVFLTPKGNYIDITWEIRNLSQVPFEDLHADYCVNVNAGGGKWVNRQFLPHSTLDRHEDGKYWYDIVASKGAYIYFDGRLVPFSPTDSLDAPIDGLITVLNEAQTKQIFLMWDSKALTPFINNENACMHLRPLVSKYLAPGSVAIIHGRAGISSGKNKELLKLYHSLQQDNK